MSRQPDRRHSAVGGAETFHVPAIRTAMMVTLSLSLLALAGSLAVADDTSVANAVLLDQKVKAVLDTPGYRNAHWGILVVDGRTGRTVYERNSRELFTPASVTKLFSTAAAMVELGTDYRFETPIVRRGEVDASGTLHGDLILIAQGDLSMGGRTNADGELLFKDNDHIYAGNNPKTEIVPAEPLAGLNHLASEVLAAGIKQVTGDIVIDDRLFEATESTGSGPNRTSPILINDNLADVLITPGKAVGEPASVSFIPETPYLSMDAVVETVAASEKPRIEVRGVGPRRFQVRGKIPVGHARFVDTHEIDDPPSFARALLIGALKKQGVKVNASPLGANETGDLPPRTRIQSLPRVAVYTSPPFREFLKVILKVSHNLQASTLPLLLASRKGGRTLEDGLRRQGEVLKSLGVEPDEVSFGGGAGGARADMATPRATVTLLQAIAARPDFAAFNAALPILGRDGTLATAVPPDSPALGHAHAKTGTFWVNNGLTGHAVLTSKALAGYLENVSGRPLVFAFFINNIVLDTPRPGHPVSESTAEAGRLLGKLCEAFYSVDVEGTAESEAGKSQNGERKPVAASPPAGASQ